MVKVLPQKALLQLKTLFPPGDCLTDEASCWVYGYDNSRRQALPWAVVFITSHEQVVELVKWANQHEIPLLAHGRGTATTGAAVPIHAGVVASFERFNQVIAFEPADRFIVVQAGISNFAVQAHIRSAGLFWAPDPSSSAFSSVGGNLACNAAGPRTVKYGSCRENTLGLRIVTGDGNDMYTGVRTTKGVVGYDLTRLVIGSEGTLAIITEATLKLTPLPLSMCTLQVTFDSIESATQAIVALMALESTPSSLEFMDSMALELIRSYKPGLFSEQARAFLLVEMEDDFKDIASLAKMVEQACKVSGLLEVRLAITAEERARLWQVRKALSPLLRKVGNQKINEDVVVPVTQIPTLLRRLGELSARYGIKNVNFGHAGNGNIHVNLLFDGEDRSQLTAAKACLEEVFSLVLTLGGTLSGEHGVGLDKQAFLEKELGAPALAMMVKIKQCFDPKGVLNPGKGIDFVK